MANGFEGISIITTNDEILVRQNGFTGLSVVSTRQQFIEVSRGLRGISIITDMSVPARIFRRKRKN